VLGLGGGLLLFASSVRRLRRGLSGFEGEMTPTPSVNTLPIPKMEVLTEDEPESRFSPP
jgi:hypothetical protein